MQRPVGRVEVDVPVEQRLDRPRPQSGRQRRQYEAIQQLEALDLPAIVAHPAPAQNPNPARTYARVPSTLWAAATLKVLVRLKKATHTPPPPPPATGPTSRPRDRPPLPPPTPTPPGSPGATRKSSPGGGGGSRSPRP